MFWIWHQLATWIINERDVGTIKYKLKSLEQSSFPCSSKSYMNAKIVDRAGARAADLGGLSVYQEGPKFEIKHNKSNCF